jgi:hypothetical protein
MESYWMGWYHSQKCLGDFVLENSHWKHDLSQFGKDHPWFDLYEDNEDVVQICTLIEIRMGTDPMMKIHSCYEKKPNRIAFVFSEHAKPGFVPSKEYFSDPDAWEEIKPKP